MKVWLVERYRGDECRGRKLVGTKERAKEFIELWRREGWDSGGTSIKLTNPDMTIDQARLLRLEVAYFRIARDRMMSAPRVEFNLDTTFSSYAAANARGIDYGA